MSPLFRFAEATEQAPAVEEWRRWQKGALGEAAVRWFAALRECGPDVREVLHDGQPTACVGDAAFAYVDVFKTHVNVGFFCGAELPDPEGVLEGSGKMMRHVKVRPRVPLAEAALRALIREAYADMRRRLKSAN